MKTKDLTKTVMSSLLLPEPLSLYRLGRDLRELFPDQAILETEDWEFNLLDYAGHGYARVRVLPDTLSMQRLEWENPSAGIEVRHEIALFEVETEESTFLVLTVGYDDCSSKRHWIIGPSEPVIRRFFADVCRVQSEVKGEILVWHYGQCQRDSALYNGIRSASFDDLILAGDLKRQLIEDFESFFGSEELYRKYNIAWRRGLILIGPPGNGKTHAVKALVQRVGKPCLYVRSFKTRYGEENGICAAFQQARKMAPGIMVLEDVDSLVKPETRSFFLNELDGFAQNRGLLVVATTNHPEKLDAAIIDRPSRFDRKITFGLPEQAERLRFLQNRVASWERELKPTNDELRSVAQRAEGFSFAYLKELCTSSLMAWMSERTRNRMGAVMESLIDTLREQMKTEPHPEAQSTSDDDESDD